MSTNIPFYAWVCNFNTKKFEPYDIMPTLMNDWNEDNAALKPQDQNNWDDMVEWVQSTLMYHYWCKCEYEMIWQSWPTGRTEKKVDIYTQCLPNIDTITEIFIKNIDICK